MHFCRDILLGHHKEKTQKRLNYHTEEWHASTPYDINQTQSNYKTVCLLLNMSHWTNHWNIVFGKCIFVSNFEVTFSLSQDCLNYICRINDTDEKIFAGTLHAIRPVPPKFPEKIKYEIKVIDYHRRQNYHYLHCSNFHLPHIPHY